MKKLKEMAKLKFTKDDSLIGNLLENIFEGKQILKLRKGTEVFSQGTEADSIFFIESGRVKVSVALPNVRELALALLGPGDFFGEGCLIGQTLRFNTATATESSRVFKIEKRPMLRALDTHPELSEKFIATLIVRNIDVEEDICNQLLNDVEKRLAHVLLRLNRHGRSEALPDSKLGQVSHETLADLAGATRAEIMHFLNKFKGLGLIDYDSNNGIVVRAQMLTDIVLAV